MANVFTDISGGIKRSILKNKLRISAGLKYEMLNYKILVKKTGEIFRI